MASSTTHNGTRNNNQTNGVLPIAPSQTSNASKQSAMKVAASNAKTKVIVRRLAPGLTEAEFTAIIGDEWQVGNGKVDWFQYKPGKDSKDAAKPSRPSRAYLHLTSHDDLLPLSDMVRKSNFDDAKNTYSSSCLIGPPTVEFSHYSRVPAGRRRTDARAGSIDQDPEFMAFLEGLANPTSAKETTAEGGEDEKKAEKVTMTPLVQFLKDKKANKTKEAAVKAAKKQETSKAKTKDGPSATEEGKKSGKDSKSDKVAASHEAVKILNREAAKKTAAPASSSSTSTTTTETTTLDKTVPKLDTSKIPANERQAVVAAHVRMLRRDLGLNPSQAHRRIRRDTAAAVKAESSEKPTIETNTANTTSAPVTPITPTGPKAGATPPSAQSSGRRNRRGNQNNNTESSTNKPSTPASPATPMVLLRKPDTPQRTSTPATSTATQTVSQTPPAGPATSQQTNTTPTPAQNQNQNRAAKVEVPTKGAKQAFIKHANPSQGVTEALLQEALEKFGKVSGVEIDKKKGFAYADFDDAEGLKKAMAANPIAVAQGTVHVLQRKGGQARPAAAPAARAPQTTPPVAPASTGRGGRRSGRAGGRGGGGVIGPANAR